MINFFLVKQQSHFVSLAVLKKSLPNLFLVVAAVKDSNTLVWFAQKNETDSLDEKCNLSIQQRSN